MSDGELLNLPVPSSSCAAIDQVVAKEEIAPGEEVTISYVDPFWVGDLRRDTLKRSYGFDCHCRLCLTELAKSN